MNQLDTLAQKAIAMLRGGEDGDPTYVKCRELYMVLKCQPALIKTVENPKDVARALNCRGSLTCQASPSEIRLNTSIARLQV